MGEKGTVYRVGAGVNLDRIDSRIERIDSRVADLEKSLSAALTGLVAMRVALEDLRAKPISEARMAGRADHAERPYQTRRP